MDWTRSLVRLGTIEVEIGRDSQAVHELLSRVSVRSHIASFPFTLFLSAQTKENFLRIRGLSSIEFHPHHLVLVEFSYIFVIR